MIDITLFSGTNQFSFDAPANFDLLQDTIRATRPPTHHPRQRDADRRRFRNQPAARHPLPPALNSLCIEVDTTILLIGHNNRTGDFTGSSAWENRVRSRIHMKREKDDESGDQSYQALPPESQLRRD